MARQFAAASSQKLAVLATPVTAYPFTMAAWAYSDDVANFYGIMHYGDKDVANIYFGIYFAGTVTGDPIRIAARNTTLYSNDTTTAYSAGAWVHVAGVFVSATERYVYLNGGSKGGGTGLSSVLFSSAIDRLSLGVFDTSSPGGYLNGRMAEAAIWNTNLSDAQIALLAAGDSPISVLPGNLKGYWQLEGISSPEPDVSGLGNNLTVTGATQVAGPGRKITAVQGSCALSGQALAFLRALKVPLVQGPYALAGQALGLKAGRMLAAIQGACSLSGQAVALRADRKITAAQGGYALSGQALGFVRGLKLPVAQGPYSLTGKDVGLNYVPLNAAFPYIPTFRRRRR